MTLNKKNTITVLGAGNMGMALAKVVAENGHPVLLWDLKKFLPKQKLPLRMKATADLQEALKASNIAVIAIPSPYLRGLLKKIPKRLLKHEILVNCSKGIEPGSLKRMGQVLEAMTRKSGARIVDFSGPSIANELQKKELTAVTLASHSPQALKKISTLFKNKYFRVKTSSDLIGVELGGIMKNVYSIGIGITDTLRPSANTRSYLLTQALEEMMMLGKVLGAKTETFSGLSGMGDLIATCLSKDSRNRKLGEAIARGKSVAAAQKEIGQVTEGYYAAVALSALARKHRVKLPLLQKIHRILYKKASPKTLFDPL
jgi:glycerol-3-phosphate dehydrogenase (NAD(P)+)